MKKIMIPFLFVLCFGCQNETDEYVINHTETKITETYKEFTIEVYLENEKDLYKASVSLNDLLLAEEIAYNITNVEEIKNVLLFMPTDAESWAKFNATGGYIFDDCGWDCIIAVHVEDTELTNFIIAINPKYWQNMSRKDLIKIFIHELVHEISRRIEGNVDQDHKNKKYWGKDGLVEQIYDKVILLMS